jgi:ATP-dependent Clp protease ATP-binding subunit ClpA
LATKKVVSFPKRCDAAPYSVVLFDEIEKAHPDVMHLLLQILEEGKITDSLGRKIDFRNTIIIMTSNVGAELIKRQTALGFGAIAGHGSYEAMRDKILDESKRVFKPEFLNRLDDMIVFHQLERNDLASQDCGSRGGKSHRAGTRQGYQGSPGYDRSRVSDR